MKGIMSGMRCCYTARLSVRKSRDVPVQVASWKSHGDDLVGIGDRAAVALPLLDRVDVLHAFDDLAPHRVLAVEPRGIREADEELAVGAVRIAAARHRARAAHVPLAREFRLQIGLLRSARPRS